MLVFAGREVAFPTISNIVGRCISLAALPPRCPLWPARFRAVVDGTGASGTSTSLRSFTAWPRWGLPILSTFSRPFWAFSVVFVDGVGVAVMTQGGSVTSLPPWVIWSSGQTAARGYDRGDDRLKALVIFFPCSCLWLRAVVRSAGEVFVLWPLRGMGSAGSLALAGERLMWFGSGCVVDGWAGAVCSSTSTGWGGPCSSTGWG